MLDLACFAFSRTCIASLDTPVQPGCIAMPHQATFAGRRFPAEATARLVGIVQTICLRELQLHIDDECAIVGVQTEIHHVGGAVPGIKLFVHGRAEPGGASETVFDVFVDDPHDRVATARVVVYAAEAPRVALLPRWRLAPAGQEAAHAF